MNLSDDQIRTLVREAIARIQGPIDCDDSSDLPQALRPGIDLISVGHASHVRLALPQGGDGEGACLIEPAVRCNHCGFCQSFGH